MWTSRREQLANGRIIRFAIDIGSSPLPYADVLRHWQNDATFRSFFNALLSDSPFAAFRWETPPITNATANRPFEFVILDNPGLARSPEAHAFAEHFARTPEAEVIEFANLGRDAIMIVPCPQGTLSAYGHLGAFVRHAPESQRHSLWSMVGAAMQRRLNATSVWLSTAGAGVSWLHVRLDDRPKYYGYTPFRDDA